MILLGCDEFDSRLKVYNKSNKRILAECSKDTIIEDSLYYDLLVTPGIVRPNETISFTYEKWDIYIKNEFQDSKLHMFIFDYEKLTQYAVYGKVISRDSLYKRYDLTVDSLEKMNWTITYPYRKLQTFPKVLKLSER
ncbi:MAG TPA: hypothetical protein DDX39_01410 [Bacteroidales bacterium]|nr:MAG: hypothetical protein A2W98_07625 [Bacteroidetes bacterium GWF2_33_38]OFY76546.1 MAG: hypothetical protein A2265_11000 [Bacteroidetes bacterium RIFOXYA12_FULL_33_9]HBF87269.1 hypothetical protein [Bacteroidales bacterium]